MIRLLIIGIEARYWGEALLDLAPSLVIDTSRLPSAGVRQFTKTPPDALCLLAAGNLQRTTALIRSIRATPLGEWIPIVIVVNEDASGIDPSILQETLEKLKVFEILPASIEPANLLHALERQLDLSPGELTHLEGQAVVTLQSREISRPVVSLSEDTVGEDDFISPDEVTYPNQFVPKRPTRVETSAYIIEQIVDAPNPPSVTDPSRGATRSNSPPTRHGDPSKVVHRTPPRLQPSRTIQKTPVGDTDPIAAMTGPVDANTIQEMLQRVRNSPYHEILGLSVEQTRRQPGLVDDLFHLLSRRFDPRHIDLRYTRQFSDELAEIRDAVGDAHAVIGHVTLREQYYSALDL